MSLRELWTEFAAARQRHRREYERDVSQAYLIEYMARQKEISGATIKKLLNTGNGKQTPQEQKQVMYQIAALYGLKIQQRPRQVARG